MSKREKTEYQSKVINDSGLTRGRVPTPLLKALGARPGDSMVFRLTDSGKAILRVSRARTKPGKKSSRKRASVKRR